MSPCIRRKDDLCLSCKHQLVEQKGLLLEIISLVKVLECLRGPENQHSERAVSVQLKETNQRMKSLDIFFDKIDGN